MMPILLLITLSASLFLNTALARLALQRNWCDHPGAAKIHTQPIPFTGGIGILLTWSSALLILSLFFSAIPLPLLLIPATAALVIGTCDDFYWKSRTVPFIKLLLQTFVAILIVLLLPHRSLVSTAGTILLVLLAFNAFNLADGIDGLAGGEALISFLGLAAILATINRHDLLLPLLLLTATLAGFLILNLQRPTRLFLGDGGSHLIGATFATFALTIPFSHRASFTNDPWTAIALLLLLGAPLIDLIWVTVCRLYLRRPILASDRNHLYDLLAKTALGPRRTVLVFWLCHAILVFTAVTILLLEVR
ncbi:MAG: glycosyltransferase family 4 protein [bacterium]